MISASSREMILFSFLFPFVLFIYVNAEAITHFLSLRGRTAPVAIRNTLYLTPPVSLPPGPHSLQHGPGGGNMKGTTNSAKIFLESGTGKVCRPPPPRRLEMAIMLSMESMIAMVPGSKKSPGRQKAAG